ncbi:MAG: protein phosphatase 2C domain-containing protein, partial [Treponema sp.]|nr:protein phosphatase 2C domain-containing protein [Treponema sp.]
ETAIECIKQLIAIRNTVLPKPDESLNILKRSIIAAWHGKIANDARRDPINGDTILPYGTTLLAAAITGHYWFVIQIGDGKCVVINKDGSISQPVPCDESCFLNLTTSLCDEEADIIFRYFYSETLPDAIFLGSDGLENSFPVNKNEEYLAIIYKRIHDNFMKEGLLNGESHLREMLPLLTQKGSGDDISIAGIIRIKEA